LSGCTGGVRSCQQANKKTSEQGYAKNRDDYGGANKSHPCGKWHLDILPLPCPDTHLGQFGQGFASRGRGFKGWSG
jgi:hypothetical protein